MSSRNWLLACHVSFVSVELYHLIHCLLSPFKHFLRALHRLTLRRRLFTIEVRRACSRMMSSLISKVVKGRTGLGSQATWLLSMACCCYCCWGCCSPSCCWDCYCCCWHCSQFLFDFVLLALPHRLERNADADLFPACR